MSMPTPYRRALAAATLTLTLVAGCADPLLGPTGRAQGRQCNALVVPEQREACFRDINGERAATVPRKLESPRQPVATKAGGDASAERKEDAAARAARRGLPERSTAAASAPAP